MSDNLILYEPVESENGLTCPYPGCNKFVDISKRTQLEAHIRSHRKRKRKNKIIQSPKAVDTDDVKVEVIESIDQNDDRAGKLVEFEFSDDDNGIECPYPECNKPVNSRKQKEFKAHIQSHQKRKPKQRTATENEQSKNEQTVIQSQHVESDFFTGRFIRSPVSDKRNDQNNGDECVDFTVKVEGELSETVTSPLQNDDTSDIMGDTSENITQSTDPGSEVIFPIDDEILESKPDIKIEEINTDSLSDERVHEDWFYIRDEDSIKRMFVCKLCHAEYEYLHQLHRHAFACPYKKDIGHTKIKNLVKNQFTLPRSPFLTKLKTKPPKLVLTKGNFYCHCCQQSFGYKEDLERHERTERHILAEMGQMSDPLRKMAPKSAFNCDICQKSFGYQEDLDKHERTDTHRRKEEIKNRLPKPVIQCEFCELTFKSISSLDSHRSIHHPGKRPYKCDFCDKCCKSKRGLTRHIHLVHVAKTRQRISHICDFCDKAFYHRRHLDIHLSVHTGKRDHKCPICNRAFVTVWNLWTHLKSKYHATQVNKFPKANLNEELDFFVTSYKNFTEFYRKYKKHYEKYQHGIANTYTNLEKIGNWSGVRDFPDEKSEEEGTEENEEEGEVYSDEEDTGDSEDSDWEEDLKDFEIELGLREELI